jgi:hypothetical protein
MAATYILGPFRLDAETDTLFRGGEPISLGHRAVALLRVLVEQRGIPVQFFLCHALLQLGRTQRHTLVRDHPLFPLTDDECGSVHRATLTAIYEIP